MLLHALSAPAVLERRMHDDTSGGNESYPQQIFHSFVNQLALICQVDSNGDAVSSCVVTQEPDKVVYVFASNSRSEKALEDTARSLRGILDMVPPLDESAYDTNYEIRGRMLRAVLALTSSRVWRYLKALGQQTRDCIASCERRGTERGAFEELMIFSFRHTNPVGVGLDKRLGLALGEIAWLADRATQIAKNSESIGMLPSSHFYEFNHLSVPISVLY